MLGKKFRFPDEEITQRLDEALERLHDSNVRQCRARERLESEPPTAEEADLDRALDAGDALLAGVG